ncbi:MAG: hypothetical protein VR64_01505 [Desulfatitalea sp. BRH_c12]|nr:MAG: hypothetical protein VR64_01505 [Desulfatitalea sp. BRH_c12]
MPAAQRINCQRCRHYFVTWEKANPHGCRCMGFKSKHLPSAVVQRNSGAACLCFEPRQRLKHKS